MNRPDLIGIDFASVLRKAAQEIWEEGQESARKADIEAQKYKYEEAFKIDVMVFQMRVDPPVWRIETLQPGPNGMGIVKAYDPCERFLEAELRNVLAGKLEVYGIAKDSAQARELACKAQFVYRGRVVLRDSERFEGERGPR